MSITLTKAVRIAGSEVAAGSTVLNYSAELEADLVARGVAVYVTPPAIVNPVAPNPDYAAAVVGAAGVVKVSPADSVEDAVVVTTLDGMSTGTPIDVAAPGEFRKVRLYWRNISATSTRKLYVAANAENSVRGLMQSQDANRRVAEMAFADHIMLHSAAPITGLTFSSDGSITTNTHSLLIVWGN